MTELKPCPFCCGKAKWDKDWQAVVCTNCGASTRHSILVTRKKREAIEAWNTRANPWQTGTPTESGEYLVCIRYDFNKEGYTTANYVEPYNPHTGWYNLKPPSVEDGHEWCKKNGIEIIAWQRIEPHKEASNDSD